MFFSALPGLSDAEVVEINEDVLKGQLTEYAISKRLFYVGPNFRLLSKMIAKLKDIRVRAGAKIDKETIEAAWQKIQLLDLDGPKK